MRSILFDELLDSEIDSVRAYLGHEAIRSSIEDLYWIKLPRELWSETQKENSDESNGEKTEGFYKIAVEVGSDWVRFELLVRSDCLINTGGGRAEENQVLYVLRWANNMAKKLKLAC